MVVHAKTLQGGVVHVLVVKRQLHAVVHVELALRLPNQAQVAVVHQDMHIGQTKLRPHRQLFDQKLEVVVTRQAHHLARGV